MSNELDVQTIKEEAERTKESLEIRQGKQPPMSQRITMSVSALLNYCERTLFLCKIIYELETNCDPAGTIQQLAITKENQKALLEQVDLLTNKNKELKETNQILANGLKDVKESLE